MSGDGSRRWFIGRAAGWTGSLMLTSLGCNRPQRTPRKATGQTLVFGRPSKAGVERAAIREPGGLPDGLSPRDFKMYTRTPLTLETRRSKMGMGVITPASLLFVRNNLPMPDHAVLDNPDEWELTVEGVEAPRSFKLRELKALGVRTVAAVLQCSGNGRRFFEHGPSGSPWGVGAAGCVLWTGVPVAAVLEAVGGPQAAAAFLTARGGDPIPALPKGFSEVMIVVERSVPLSKGREDCLLAWEMNGAPVPLTHGGPLRLVVPGYYGVNSVKYIKSLACTIEQSDAKIQRSGYRVRSIGQKAADDQPTMWRMNVKSWINGPGADGEPVLAGKVLVHGVAFSGERRIRKVEVSVDGGRTWAKARLLEPDLGKYAWRTFAHETELGPGKHVLISRATDAVGDVQPEHRRENERGYGNNAWRDMALDVEAFATLPDRRDPPPDDSGAAPTRSAPVQLSATGQRGREVFVHHADPPCGVCHTLADAKVGMKLGPSLDDLALPEPRIQNAVTNGAGAMPGYRDKLTEEEIKALATYVFEATRK